MKRSPGAYVHNSVYARRLIYDSIDWIDDGILNDSVSDSITALGGAVDADAAKTYLLSAGGGRR